MAAKFSTAPLTQQLLQDSDSGDAARETDMILRENDISSCSFSGVSQTQSVSSESRLTASPGKDLHQSPIAAQFCVVCGEVANGNFFGAVVCLPCKSFFIRCTKEGEPSILQQCSGKCDIQKQLRNRCQFCRYRQCLSVGMTRKEKPECIQPQEGQELCKVCGDLANGIHFGVHTCEGCKKFFRRGMKEHDSYACKGQGNCTLNPRNRNNCRFCRFQKCILVGMSREAIKMGRPRKIYPSRSLDGVVQTLESLDGNSKDSFSNIKEESRAFCENDSREVRTKLIVDEALPCRGQVETKLSNRWSVEGRVQISDKLIDSDETSVFPRALQQTVITQHHELYIHNQRLLEALANQVAYSDHARKLLEPVHSQSSSIHDTSLAVENSGLYKPVDGFYTNGAKSNSAASTIAHMSRIDDFGFSDRSRVPELYPSTFMFDGQQRALHTVVKEELYAENITVESGQGLGLTTEPTKKSTKLQQLTYMNPKDSVWIADLASIHQVRPVSMYSKHDIFSPAEENNKNHQFSSPRISQTKQTEQNDSPGLPLKNLKLKREDTSHDSFSERDQRLSPQQQILPEFQIFSREFGKLTSYQSIRKRQAEDSDSPDLSDDKSARYDSLILDLSVNTKTHSPPTRNSFQTNNFLCRNNIKGNRLCDIYSRSSNKIEEQDIDLKETTDQNAAKISTVQSCSCKLNNGSRSDEHVLFMHENFDQALPLSPSSRIKQIRSDRFPEVNSLCSDNHQHKIINIYPETNESVCHKQSSLMSPLSEIAAAYEQQKLLTTASTWDWKAQNKAHSGCESEFLTCPKGHTSSSTRFSSAALPLPKLALVPNSATKAGKNCSTVKLSTSAASVVSSVDLSSIVKHFLVSNYPGEKKSTPPSFSVLTPPERVLSFTENDVENEASGSKESSGNSSTEQEGKYTFSPYTNEQTILCINEMFMVVDTLADVISSSVKRTPKDKICTELETLDEMFTSAYEYSPLKVSQFWKNIQSSVPSVSSDKWPDILTPDQLCWLQDITGIYTAQVDACDEDINPPSVNTNMCEMWPPQGEDTDHWRHFQERVAKQTYAVAQFFLKLPEMDKIHPKDRIKLGNNTRLFGNAILMASREWFDPVRKRFKFFWNWKFPLKHPLYPFRNHMIKLGSHIFNMHMDKTEVAILSALNIVSPENGTFHNLIQLSGHTQTLIKIICYYLYTINVDPEERIPELLSVMPKVRHMTMWYSNLIKNMRADPTSMDKTLQDLTVMAEKLSHGDMRGSLQ